MWAAQTLLMQQHRHSSLDHLCWMRLQSRDWKTDRQIHSEQLLFSNALITTSWIWEVCGGKMDKAVGDTHVVHIKYQDRRLLSEPVGRKCSSTFFLRAYCGQQVVESTSTTKVSGTMLDETCYFDFSFISIPRKPCALDKESISAPWAPLAHSVVYVSILWSLAHHLYTPCVEH